MEIKLNIGYEQLLDIINQLPAEEVSKLKLEIEKIVGDKDLKEQTDLKTFITNGPVMTDEQFGAFEENRKSFDQWRAS